MPTLGSVPIYAGAKVGKALDEVTEEMDFYHGVRLAEVMEAVYEQGRVDGRAQVVSAFQDASDEITSRKDLRYRNPGKPRAKKKKPSA
ncbi:phage gp36-like protein [Microbacterium testaceum]|uniref:hypothetical protein n=1 Tax=Microbacterium TaxID=33882 RepID=UPI002271C186|nr:MULTISPECIES: hypothetical protein [Microbacterium]MDQ1111175.1 phage gp36-like protein [Microbacterium testaceum]MDR6098285.1 phage gp36-like protein [Microbacterium sp. SORGH_AS_0454]WAC68896.1 hypothetical protein OVA17_15110 [Microbacterium sp. SL75]